MIYATPTELALYIDPDATNPTPPPLATVLLRTAAALVQRAIAAAVYTVDADELPTDPILRAAVKNATCEQASAWSINDIDPRKGAAGLKPIVTTKALDGVSVGYGQSAPIQQALVELAAGDSLTSAAWLYLSNAGLISNRASTTNANLGRAYNLTPEGSMVLGTATLGS